MTNTLELVVYDVPAVLDEDVGCYVDEGDDWD